jgi:hypothetical protein
MKKLILSARKVITIRTQARQEQEQQIIHLQRATTVKTKLSKLVREAVSTT